LRLLGVLIGVFIWSGSSFAGKADVLEVGIHCTQAGLCEIDVTVQHDDENWDHYADRWELLTETGGEIAVRELAHPHVDEQPFTRSLKNVRIPEGVNELRVRAHDSVHGYGGKEKTATIRADKVQ
jgi:hypothetical protein